MTEPADVRPADVRPADAEETAAVAALLDAFNLEFEVDSPGPAVLAERLGRHLPGGQLVALVAGDPPCGLALVSLRPNAWYDGPVGLLDELYVQPARRNQGIGTRLLRAAEALVQARGGELLEINVDGEDLDARRFYERHGYRCHHGDPPEPELYYARELGPPT